MVSLTVLYVFVVILVAGVLQTLTGFGFALVAAPLLTLATSSKEAVVLVLFIGILMKGFMVYKTWSESVFSHIMVIFAASIIGALPGIYVMRILDDNTLKIFIGFTLVLATLLMCFNFKVTIHRHRLAKIVVGFLSGFLGATTSLNGPPIVLYMMNEGGEKTTMRADLVRYFFLGNTATLSMAYFMGGLPTNNLSLYAITAIPAILLSWLIGEKVFHVIDVTLFRRLSLAVISVSAFLTLGSGLYPFFSNFLNVP